MSVIYLLGGHCEQGTRCTQDPNMQIQCPSLYDDLFESPQQINFERQFANTTAMGHDIEDDNPLVSFINSFCPNLDQNDNEKSSVPSADNSPRK